MTFATGIPDYLQGHFFNQSGANYNGSDHFYDQAGYEALGNGMNKTAGTPAFSTHGANSREGMLLDNTNQWQGILAIPWEGTMLVVFKPTLVSAAVGVYPYLFGTAATTSNARVLLGRNSGVNSFQCLTGSSVLVRSVTGIVSGNITIAAFSLSQKDRKIYSTQDGITVTGTTALAGTTNGNGVALGSSSTTDPVGRFMRLGDFTNNQGVSPTPNATDYMYIFEHHFWKGDVLNNNASLLAAFIASRKTYYGI